MPIYLDKGNRSDISYIWWFYNELQVFVLNPDIHYILTWRLWANTGMDESFKFLYVLLFWGITVGISRYWGSLYVIT